MIILDQASKTYRSGRLRVPVLKDISTIIDSSELVAIMGPSGSGKSTLMNIIGLLDRPSSGSLTIGSDLVHLNMSDTRLARLRANYIGFVFQSFNLLPKMTALANVMLPSMYTASKHDEVLSRARHLLFKLGLKDRALHRPSELSGGEKQRVAIARALINDPQIILADEPTGNLDSKSGREVVDILVDLHQHGKTVIVVTHDDHVAARCPRVIQLLDGVVKHDVHAKGAA